MGISEVIKTLNNLILHPANKQVEKFVSWSLEKFINEKNLSYAIENDLDIITLTLNHYSLGHSSVTPLFKLSMKMYWEEVESYLINVEKIYSIISKNPKCAKILNTEKGKSYLNRCCKTAYDQLYSLIWEE